MLEYYPIYGDFQDGKLSTIIQFYAIPVAYDNNNYYNSKTGIYSYKHTRLYEGYDGYAFKTQLDAEYNGLRNGLTMALKEDCTHIVLHTNASKVIDNILDACNDDSESESSTVSVLSLETQDLHDIVMELLYEFDSIGFSCLEPNILVQFEEYVQNMSQMSSALKGMALTNNTSGTDYEMM